MWSIFSLWCLFVIYVSSAEENILTNNTKSLTDSRIIGGSTAAIADHPHQVAIIYEKKYFTCGGSLIKWNWVLTAAHCTSGTTKDQLSIRAGSRYWNSLGIVSHVIAIYINPTYTRATISHDCSLMKIPNLQTYATTYSIGIIGLATSLPPTNTYAVLAGWGDTSMNGITPTQLQSANIKLLDWSWCQYSYGGMDSSMLCGGKWEGGVGFCFGDSGGGLKYQQQLIGIVSYASAVCAAPGYPGVYASVPYLRTWILNTIQVN